jgi:hypothetical protein
LGQYILDKKGSLIAFDTDFHNKTFASYKALNAQPLHLVDDKTLVVNVAALDVILEATLSNEADVVIDVGASSFKDFFKYLLDMDLASAWVELGHNVVFHVVIGGGTPYINTLETFETLVTRGVKGKGTKCLPWLNAFTGPLESDGVPFEESEPFRANVKKIAGLVTVPIFDELFRATLEKITTEHLTFDEVKDSQKFLAAEKIRAIRIKKEFYNALDVQTVIL